MSSYSKLMEPTPAPAPTEEPRPEEQPAPAERPRRRRFIQPVFSTRFSSPGRITRMVVSSFALLFSAFTLVAQTEPQPTQPPPSKPVDPQTPGQPRPVAQGWVMFNDNMGRELSIPDDQLQKLRDVDARYQREYSALGNEPWTAPGYRSLTDRRNADVKGVLSPEQYARWNRKYSETPNTIQNDRSGPTGTSTPPSPKP